MAGILGNEFDTFEHFSDSDSLNPNLDPGFFGNPDPERDPPFYYQKQKF